MQAAAFKDKKRGSPAHREGAKDPDYENITLAFRNQNQPKGGHPPLTSQAQPRSPSDRAQVPHWLYRAIMSLYILLTVALLFCIILSALVLVKNSEMSKEVRNLKTEIWNVTNLMQECEKRQEKGFHPVQQSIGEVRRKVENLATQLAEINKINTNIEKTLQDLKKTSTSPA
ncbi:mast cell-expressed membrane protein 1 isoform X2 [Lemur catta]|uniref:mast cell-expressed membrane protein 1 isoform X2 n=1 Tax=Lemur catta TaxID=9447 RepID=UPI001E26E787|nr:mast cell-expressed membrane protein 1 isoform X2 [Lemur catta]